MKRPRCVYSVGDSDAISESEVYSMEFVDELIEVQPDVSPSVNGLSAVRSVNSGPVETSGAGPASVASTSRRHSHCLTHGAAVERELDVRIKKVKTAMDSESMLNERRMKAAELDIKIKEETLKQLREAGERSMEVHKKTMLYLKIEHEQKMANLLSLSPAQQKP